MSIITDIDSIELITEGREQLELIDNSSKVSALASVQWSSQDMHHSDEILLDNLNAWRDYFPPEIDMQLSTKRVGDSLSCNINDEELIPPWDKKLLHTVRQDQFDRQFSSTMNIEPRVGRFYPRGILSGIEDNYKSNLHPCRLTAIDAETISSDFNHPLAQHECTLQLVVTQVWAGKSERGGRCNDIVEMCTEKGPGMQARWQGNATDFFAGNAVARMDESPDQVFYGSARMVQHLDSACRNQISQLYGRLLPTTGHVLDLMSSCDSHLPDACEQLDVTGLGMNQQELDSNARLSQRVVHDLNLDNSLPFDDAAFDAVICTASFEYLVSPQRIVAELARVLKPGGVLAITFSNRWFPPKAIALWSQTHDFEHMGIVAECLFESGSFTDLNSWSLRGLPRPSDDKYADSILHADPLFAVWAQRK